MATPASTQTVQVLAVPEIVQVSDVAAPAFLRVKV